jgi:hypothetical protein
MLGQLPVSLTRRCHSPAASCSRLRIRAVTGSSADARRFAVRCGVASMVCAALSVLIRSASSATVGGDVAVWSKNSNAGYQDEKSVFACGVSEWLGLKRNCGKPS